MSLRDFVLEIAGEIARGRRAPMLAHEIMAEARSAADGPPREPYKDAPERSAPPEPEASSEPPTPPGELFPSGDAFAGGGWD